MKIFYCLILSVFVFSGCGNTSPQKENVLLNQKLDSLSNQISELQKQVAENKVQDAVDKKAEDSVSTNPVKQPSVPPQQKTIVKIQPTINPVIAPQKIVQPQSPTGQPTKRMNPEPANSVAEVDTAFYYYTGLPKRISVKVTPWMNGRRKIIFYNPFGNVTYTCDDVRMSYSITTQLKKFYPNGAAALIEIHNNPGASLYWSDTDIIFGINNEPQWRTIHKKPVESMEDAMENKFYWNEAAREWVKQEVVREQAVPRK